MTTLVMIIMALTVLGFLLKASCHGVAGIATLSVAAAAAVWLSRDSAASQSSMQIAGWLANPELMLDTAVVLTIDVALQIAFCLTALSPATERCKWQAAALRWLPGVMIFPVLFAMLVELIFILPGHDFDTIAASAAVTVLLLVPMLSKALQALLPEKELRLEMLFVTALLSAALGVVATVDGRTAAAGCASAEWPALAGVALMACAGFTSGLVVLKIKNNRKI